MTNWRTIVGNSETISAGDLAGRDVTVIISAIEGGIIEDKDDEGKISKDKKALITFKRAEKKLAANTTNCLLLEAMWGPEYEAWVGHAVTLGEDAVEIKGKFFGKPCVRVKGSPELSAPQVVTIELPRRRPFKKVLAPTGHAADPVTGELPAEDSAPAAQETPQDAPTPADDSEPAAATEAPSTDIQRRRVTAEFKRLKMNKPDQLDALKEFGVSDAAELVASAADELIGMLAIMEPEDAAMGQGELA